jgi:outer membrane receptor protein involved in Fe transport
VAAVRTNPAILDTELSVSLDGRQEAVYLQDRWHAGPNLTLLGGLRWENGSLWGERFLHPRFQMAHQITERDRWSLAWGRYSQSQRPYELSIEDGERELRPLERAEELVLGWDRRLGKRFRLTSEAFQRTVAHPQPRWANLFDPFSVFPENEPDRVLVQVTDVRTLGAAVSLAGRFSKQLEGSLALTGTSVRERVAGDDVTGANDRPWDVRLRFVWDPSPPWSVRFAWRYSAGAPTTPLVLRADEHGEVVPTLGPLRVDRLPDYHALDLEVARGWRLGTGRLDLLFDVENAYGHENARGYEYQVLNDPGAPRLERETLTWPGVVPSFRVRFEF